MIYGNLFMWTTEYQNTIRNNTAPKGEFCLVTSRPSACSPRSLWAFLYEQTKKIQSTQLCIIKKRFAKRPQMEKTIKFSQNSLYLYARQIQQRNSKQNNFILQ